MTDGASEGNQLPLWPFLGAAAIAVVAVAAVLLAPDPQTSLRVDGSTSYRHATGRGPVPAGTPYSFSLYSLCVAHGKVTIDSVLPRDPSDGLKVVDWAVRSSSGDEGFLGASGKAAKQPGYAGTVVSTGCSDSRLLAVSVERTAAIGHTDGFEVHSTSGTVVLPLDVTLCERTCPDALSQSGTP